MGERYNPFSAAIESVKRVVLPVVAGLSIGANVQGCDDEPEKEKIEDVAEKETRVVKLNPYFDNHPEFLKPVAGGVFSESERKKRTEILENGEEIFHDYGLDFYHVKKGDTISEILQRLIKYPKYKHLLDQKKIKLQSFNIPAKQLQAGIWIPIPMENEDRQLSNEQFVGYAKQGIDDIKDHDKYGPEVREMIDKIGFSNVVAVMMALAKQESGGLPLGQFESHRWENGHKVFSFSMFHILMEKGGPGLKARKLLNFTEGQTYHPRNGVKLSLGYMAQKTHNPARFFPLDVEENHKRFATFYNGGNWPKDNPDWPGNVLRYYKEAKAFLEEHPELLD